MLSYDRICQYMRHCFNHIISGLRSNHQKHRVPPDRYSPKSVPWASGPRTTLNWRSVPQGHPHIRPSRNHRPHSCATRCHRLQRPQKCPINLCLEAVGRFWLFMFWGNLPWFIWFSRRAWVTHTSLHRNMVDRMLTGFFFLFRAGASALNLFFAGDGHADSHTSTVSTSHRGEDLCSLKIFEPHPTPSWPPNTR